MTLASKKLLYGPLNRVAVGQKNVPEEVSDKQGIMVKSRWCWGVTLGTNQAGMKVPAHRTIRPSSTVMICRCTLCW